MVVSMKGGGGGGKLVDGLRNIKQTADIRILIPLYLDL